MDLSDTFPIWLSMRVALGALVVAVPIGLFLAWFQAHHRYRLKWMVDAVILIPLVLPPSVTGFYLVWGFGRQGLGQFLESTFGLRIIFTPLAAVIASALVAMPLLVKTAQAALESVPEEYEKVGRTLGLGPLALFFRVSLPSAWRGIAAGVVLAFARALGEFGATLMFAGNIPGRTNTMPLEIFASFQAGNDAKALAYVVVLTVLSFAVVLLASRLTPRERVA
jgi:molybdate transport system permease protein